MKIINQAHRQTSCLHRLLPYQLLPTIDRLCCDHKNGRPTLLAPTGLKKEKVARSDRACERVNEPLMDRATIYYDVLTRASYYNFHEPQIVFITVYYSTRNIQRIAGDRQRTITDPG